MADRVFKVKVRNYGSVFESTSTSEYLILAKSIIEVPKKAKAASKKKGKSMLRVISIEDIGEVSA